MRTALHVWLITVSAASWTSLDELFRTFPATDLIGKLAIFNMRGNRYQLIVRMEFAGQRVDVKDFLSHAELRQGELEEMAVIDSVSYGQLFQEALPRVIETDEENERLLAVLEQLDELPSLTPEQESLAELLTMLIRQFEARYDLGSALPLEALRSLMEDRGLRQRDLLGVFGLSSVASDVLNGKREISKLHARRLAEYFRVPVSVFYLRT